MSKKIVVVTALIGAYDSQLLEFEYDRDKYDFVCYTNIKRLKSDTWDIRYVDELQVEGDNAKSSYYYKWNPHTYLSHEDYDTMIWVDSSFRHIDMNGMDNFVSRFNDAGKALFIEKHPSRDTLQDELIANIQLSKDDRVAMTEQVTRYFESGYKDEYTTMVETGLTIRDFKNPELIALSESIWNEMKPTNNTKRDQLVYDYCVWKNKFTSYSLFTFQEKMEVIHFMDHPNRSTHSEKVLLVGPWLGESEGEEAWAKFVSEYLKKTPVDSVIVGCRPNREKLYDKVSPDKFIVSDPDGVRSGNLLDNRVPRFNITSTSENKEIMYLPSSHRDFIDTDKIIYVLWATVRADEFDEKFQAWVDKADDNTQIVPVVLVDTAEDKAKIKSIGAYDVIVRKPPRIGASYPSYKLAQSLMSNEDVNINDIIVYASDDFVPMDHWDTELYKQFTTYNGSILVNDKCNMDENNDIMTIPIMTYSTLCKLNHIIYHPAYTHCWSDNELLLNLRDLGLVKDIRKSQPDLYFEHQHFINGKREQDENDNNNQLSHFTGESLWRVRQQMPLSERLKYDPDEPLLSILILTLEERASALANITARLEDQIGENIAHLVEIVIESDNREKTIGEKRNNALAKAKGRYIAFVDDDDDVADDYVKLILNILQEQDVDCCSLLGEITIDGGAPETFIHSLKYDKWSDAIVTRDGKPEREYYRPPNHLNVVRRDIAKFVGFKEISHGEDADYSMRLRPFLNAEGKIEETIYYYDAITNK